jgi:hypothetical protein
VRQRAARSRELVAAGYKPAVVARVAQISRQAIYASPGRRVGASVDRRGDRGRRGRAEQVEQAIVELCHEQEYRTDGYRMIASPRPRTGGDRRHRGCRDARDRARHAHPWHRQRLDATDPNELDFDALTAASAAIGDEQLRDDVERTRRLVDA